MPITQQMSLKKTVVAGIALFLIDGIWIGSGIISMFVAIGVILWGAISVFLRRKERSRWLFTVKKSAILVAVAMATMAFAGMQATIAETRAKTVIAAVNQYYTKNGKYPDRLEELVPAFLPSVPRSRLSWVGSDFGYSVRTDPKAHVLSYLEMLPNVVRFYTFETQMWARYE